MKDSEALETLIPRALDLLNNSDQAMELSEHIKSLGRLDADVQIAEQVYKLANKK